MKVWIRDESYDMIRPRKPVPVYIRYGLFSNRERSSNHSTGEAERGISVYPAVLTDDCAVKLTDGWETCPSLEGQGRLCFAVTGREVGVGSDGEPVLRGVRLLPYAIDITAKRL